jgi:hypothetical protein
MASNVRELMEGRHVHYEVSPYYVLLEERPSGARPTQRRVKAGFDVDLYGSIEKGRPPLSDRGDEQVRLTLGYLEDAAREIQEKIGKHCEIEIIPFEASVVLDTHEDLKPEAMLRIRITHSRGLAQPEGQPEEQALHEIREKLHELGVREGRG